MIPEGIVEAIVGVRTWIGHPENLSIWSMHKPIEWPKDVLERKCLCVKRGITYPLQDERLAGFCHKECGIYAYKDRIPPARTRWTAWRNDHIYVHGEVLLWGKVARHEMGYKAEFAMPGAFYLTSDMTNHVRESTQILAEAYEVPLVQAPSDWLELDGVFLERWDTNPENKVAYDRYVDRGGKLWQNNTFQIGIPVGFDFGLRTSKPGKITIRGFGHQ